jgi:hypothetical protein
LVKNFGVLARNKRSSVQIVKRVAAQSQCGFQNKGREQQDRNRDCEKISQNFSPTPCPHFRELNALTGVETRLALILPEPTWPDRMSDM